MHNECGTIETLGKEPRVGIDLEPIRHIAVAIGDHAVSRDDGVAFNANFPGHVRLPFANQGSAIRLQDWT